MQKSVVPRNEEKKQAHHSGAVQVKRIFFYSIGLNVILLSHSTARTAHLWEREER